ncbi:MFS general substrate transporter [Camillea tinctor]|nr:MFS general substrate transporter [Camillea tinctor]
MGTGTPPVVDTAPGMQKNEALQDTEQASERSQNPQVEERPQEGSIDPENEVRGTKLLLIFLALSLCTFLVGLDFNLIATAIPVITSEFNSIRDVGWYGAAFQLALLPTQIYRCSTQPLAGKTYVLFSKKIVFLTYLAIFEAGSLVCALAPTSNVLIGGRAIAGLGASGIFAGGLVILTTIIPLHKRPIWTGAWGSTFAIASIVGPVIGGALTQHLTWRWCFYINLPIGGFAAAICVILLRLKAAETEKVALVDKVKSLDGIGFTLFAGSITMLLLALQWGGVEFSWNSSVIIGLLVGFAVGIVLFIPWQIYLQDTALIPPRLFKTHRNIGLICGSAFFVNGPFQMIVYWLPIWFQAVLGDSPERSGIDYLPTVISDAVTSVIGSGIAMKIGYWNPFLVLGIAMVSIGGGTLSLLHPGVVYAKIIGYQILGGVGFCLATNMSHIGTQASLPMELVPIGATNLLTVISTSCSIFLAIGQLVFQRSILTNLSNVVSQDVVDRVISSGATNLASVVDATDLPAVIQAYGKSVTQVFYITAASPVISFFLILACSWITTKKAPQGGQDEKGSIAK